MIAAWGCVSSPRNFACGGSWPGTFTWPCPYPALPCPPSPGRSCCRARTGCVAGAAWLCRSGCQRGCPGCVGALWAGRGGGRGAGAGSGGSQVPPAAGRTLGQVAMPSSSPPWTVPSSAARGRLRALHACPRLRTGAAKRGRFTPLRRSRRCSPAVASSALCAAPAPRPPSWCMLTHGWPPRVARCVPELLSAQQETAAWAVLSVHHHCGLACVGRGRQAPVLYCTLL